MKHLKDIIHNEPWTLEEYDRNQPSLKCVACENKILHGSYYTCSSSLSSSSSSKMGLHKCCGDLPLEFKDHPLHPQHVIHIEKKPSENYFEPYCISCVSPCSEKYTYVCKFKTCNFFVDIGCLTLKDRKIKLKCHDHHLILHQNKMDSTCYACGIKHSGNFYQCLECVQFWINEYCNSRMKERIKYKDHPHELKLYYTYPQNLDRKLSRCEVCNKDFYMPCWIYCCEGDRFFIHARCRRGPNEEDRILEEEGIPGFLKEAVWRAFQDVPMVLKHQIGLKQSIDPNAIHFPLNENEYGTLRLINDFLVGKPNKEKEKIIHFSHPNHILLLHHTLDSKSIRKLSSTNKCGGCLRPIAAPFFSCEYGGCNFFLHKCCAQLRGSIRHPFHRHKLALCERPLEIFKAFQCYICQELCNGLVYQCEKKSSCHFHIDVECASLPKTIIHEAAPKPIDYQMEDIGTIIIHENDPHQLVLRKFGIKDKCSCCRSYLNGVGYECDTYPTHHCGFRLCPKCVLLPKQVVMPRFDKHPLKLTYEPLPSQEEESYCDICENYLDPLKGFYSCAECDIFMHGNCIFCLDVSFPKLKDYNFPQISYADSHPHPLKLGLTHTARCDHCGNDAHDSHEVEDHKNRLCYKCDEKDSYLIQAECAIKYNLLKGKPE